MYSCELVCVYVFMCAFMYIQSPKVGPCQDAHALELPVYLGGKI